MKWNIRPRKGGYKYGNCKSQQNLSSQSLPDFNFFFFFFSFLENWPVLIFKKQKHNTTSHYSYVYNSVIFKHLKAKQSPLPGSKRLKWDSWRWALKVKVPAVGHKSPTQTRSNAFHSLKCFYKKFFKTISSQTPRFCNDLQLCDICFYPINRNKK